MIMEDDCIFHTGVKAKTLCLMQFLCFMNVSLLWTPVENTLVYVLHHVS